MTVVRSFILHCFVLFAVPFALPKVGSAQSGTSTTYPTAVSSRAIDGNRASDVEGSGTCSVSGRYCLRIV